MLTSVSDLTLTSSRSGITEETKDGILDVVGVVFLQEGVGRVEERLVRVFLGHFTLLDLDIDRSGRGSGQEKGEGVDDGLLHCFFYFSSFRE